MLNTERFTEKAEETLHGAKKLATKFGQQEIDVEHLLLALLDQDESLAVQALERVGATTDALKIRVQRELERLPRVSGAGKDDRFFVSGRLNKTFERAEAEAKRRKDDHIAEDIVLLAIAEGDGAAANILHEGVRRRTNSRRRLTPCAVHIVLRAARRRIRYKHSKNLAAI